MRVAVVGGGPGGCHAAAELAGKGHDVTLYDPLVPWEKPCGGGVTTRALDAFAFLGSSLPANRVEKISIFFGDRLSVDIVPEKQVVVSSREDLGRLLLSRAVESGVRVVSERVTKLTRKQTAWILAGRGFDDSADFLVGADGATSFVRRQVGRPLASEDLCVTLGYFIPAKATGQMKIHFLPGLEGYLWSFPRPGHLSFGLITKTEPGWNVRAKQLLENYIAADLGAEALEDSRFYSAPVPCMSLRSWKSNQIVGDGWALVGDAAGFADPITGEGIYFALRSAHLLAESFPAPLTYPERTWQDFGRELARASRMYRRFYRGRFLGRDFRMRMVQLARRSRRVRRVLGGLVTGGQSYVDLKKRLILSSPGIGLDLLRSVVTPDS